MLYRELFQSCFEGSLLWGRSAQERILFWRFGVPLAGLVLGQSRRCEWPGRDRGKTFQKVTMFSQKRRRPRFVTHGEWLQCTVDLVFIGSFGCRRRKGKYLSRSVFRARNDVEPQLWVFGGFDIHANHERGVGLSVRLTPYPVHDLGNLFGFVTSLQKVSNDAHVAAFD